MVTESLADGHGTWVGHWIGEGFIKISIDLARARHVGVILPLLIIDTFDDRWVFRNNSSGDGALVGRGNELLCPSELFSLGCVLGLLLFQLGLEQLLCQLMVFQLLLHLSLRFAHLLCRLGFQEVHDSALLVLGDPLAVL
jgi:hypothetical protein